MIMLRFPGGIKEFIALAAGQQMRIEHHNRTAQLAGSELSQIAFGCRAPRGKCNAPMQSKLHPIH